MRRLLLATVLLLAPVCTTRAEVPDTVKIGVINDMSGPFADQSGKGSVVAAEMAAQDFAAAGPPPASMRSTRRAQATRWARRCNATRPPC